MRFPLAILTTPLAVTNAVTIRNFNTSGCSSSHRQSSGIAAGRCCYRQGGTYASTRFIALPAELGQVCIGTANKQCKTIQKSGWGTNPCVQPNGLTTRLKDSFWINCLHCSKKRAPAATLLETFWSEIVRCRAPKGFVPT
jgi:hypothetical protein